MSIGCFLLLNSLSRDILADSVTATGLGIAFYYGLTGFACFWYFRRVLTRSLRTLLMVGILPLVGGLILFGILGDSIYQQTNPANSSVGHAWLGVGPPLAIGIVGLAVGIVLMLVQRLVNPDPFFRMKPETGDAAALDPPVPTHA